jgi:hypothetical protein
LGTGAWQPGALGSGAKVQDTCARDGSLRLSVANGRAYGGGAAGTLRFAPPAGTRIAGYELYRSAGVTHDDRWHESEAKVIETAGATSYTVSNGAAGDPKQPLGAANRLVARHAPLDALTLQVWCGWWCDSEGVGIDLYRSRVTIEDLTAPAAEAAAAGDDAVIVTGSDRGAGVAAVTLSLDGGPVQTLASGCAPPYTALSPCPAEVARAFAVDAAGGEHRASGTVVDAAGNATAWGPVTVTVRGTAPPPAPLTAGAPLAPASEAQVLTLGQASVEHAPGAAARLSGTLKTAAGAPVAGASLTVSSFDLAADDAVPRALAPVVSDAGGRFTLTLERDGAQRVTVTSPAGAQATATVRAQLRLGVASSRGRLVKGRVLTLRGKRRGAGASARGTLVTIESIVNGRWQPVGSARSSAAGKYVWSYRFVHLARDTIFSFRAVVERGPGWPWASERSAPLKVRVDVP